MNEVGLKSLNGPGNVTPPTITGQQTQPAVPNMPTNSPYDTAEFTSKPQPPQISNLGLLFARLSDNQIKAVNKAGILPKNGKFIPAKNGRYVIRPNWLGVAPGTRQLPAGFEVKKDVLGFAVVLPKGTEGLLIRDAK